MTRCMKCQVILGKKEKYFFQFHRIFRTVGQKGCKIQSNPEFFAVFGEVNKTEFFFGKAKKYLSN